MRSANVGLLGRRHLLRCRCPGGSSRIGCHRRAQSARERGGLGSTAGRTGCRWWRCRCRGHGSAGSGGGSRGSGLCRCPGGGRNAGCRGDTGIRSLCRCLRTGASAGRGRCGVRGRIGWRSSDWAGRWRNPGGAWHRWSRGSSDCCRPLRLQQGAQVQAVRSHEIQIAAAACGNDQLVGTALQAGAAAHAGLAQNALKLRRSAGGR